MRKRTYTWKDGRRLATASDGTSTWSYKYNSDGIRTQKVIDGVKTEFFLNGTQIIAQKTGDDIMWFYYDHDGKRIGLEYQGEMYYYAYNLQGDVKYISDADGNVCGGYYYDDWGNVSVFNSGPNTVATANPFRYRGYYYDTETELYYLNSRYYNPEWGRFINADGVVSGTGESVQGYNLFAYCFNNPINAEDSDGNWPKWLKKLGKTAAKVGKTLGTVAKSFTVEFGYGFGFRASAGVAGFALSGGLKYDMLNVKIDHNGIDFGTEAKMGVSVGPESVEHVSISVEEGFYHSNNCERYAEESFHDPETCPNSTIYDGTPTTNFEIVGVDIYCLVGVSASIGWDYGYFKEEFIRIWDE